MVGATTLVRSGAPVLGLFVDVDAVMVLGAERAARLSKLGLPDGVRRLVLGEMVHPELAPWCRKLSYSVEPEDFAPHGLLLVPLWEGENSITGFYDTADGGRAFIFYYIEDIEAYRIIGGDIISVFLDLFRRFIDPADVPSVSTVLGYDPAVFIGVDGRREM